MAVATLLQMTPDQVPDFQLDKQKFVDGRPLEETERSAMQQFGQWMDDRGLTMIKHTTPPTPATRWIGVITANPVLYDVDANESKFDDHCLVMTGSECLWDPSHILPPVKREPITALPGSGGPGSSGVDDITYGITMWRGEEPIWLY
jgi:hypothetical protein